MRKGGILLKHLLIVLCVFIAATTSEANANDPDQTFFFKGDFEGAKQKAAQEGKLFFVDFYADYCYACKLMDETTFRDPSVIAYVKDNYIPFKVDIIDFDGVNLRQQYQINILPTILIFNSKGELVGRYEEMLGTNRIISELKKYDLPANRVSIGANIVDNKPSNYNNSDNNSNNNSNNNDLSWIKPTQGQSGDQADGRVSGHVIKPSTKPVVTPTQQPTPTNTDVNDVNENDINWGYANSDANSEVNTSPTPPAKKPKKKLVNVSPSATFASQNPSASNQPKTEGLFQFTVKPYQPSGFGVQYGVFAEYENVMREVQKLQGKFSHPILVNISTLKGKVVYKIIVGAFDSRRQAEAFRRMMQKQGVDGVIKDLSSIQL